MARSLRITSGIALLPLLIALPGCNPAGPDVRDQLQAQLRAQEQAWSQQGSPSYVMRIERACNCADIYDVRLEVVDSVIVSGQHAFAGQPLTATELAAQRTLPELFDVVRDALNRKVPEISVQYNRDYGYVQYMFINYDGARVDDDVVFTVTEYTPS